MYRKIVTNVSPQDVLDPFDLCWTMYEMYLTYFIVQLHVSTGIVPISGSELPVYKFTDTSLCPKFIDKA